MRQEPAVVNGGSEGFAPAEPALVIRTPPPVPDHEMLRVIGQGAYGEVWLARNIFNQYRAVKVVRRGQLVSGDHAFDREFEGIQRFEPVSRSHPSQLAILHVGKNDELGFFFYVMELADEAETTTDDRAGSAMLSEGHRSRLADLDPRTYVPKTLRWLMRNRGALPAEECLGVARALASGLTHLHAHGLIHRDVKPSNVIFVGGVPKLADIGLVARADETCSLVGTEGYMPPEGPGTPSADCYGLGKLLYEASTGNDRTAWPEPPVDLVTRPDRKLLIELNAVIHRACAPRVAERYAGGQAMLVELDLLRLGRSVRRRRAWGQRLRWGRNLGIAAGTLAVVATSVPRLAPHIPVAPAIHWSKKPEANEEYHIGNLAFNQDNPGSVDQARRHFARAVTLDPGFARAWARLAMTFAWQGPTDPQLLAKARRLAETALALDPDLDDAHHVLSLIKGVLERNWRGAEAEALRAVRLNPNSEDNYYNYAGILSAMGRTNDAILQLNKARQLDSRSILSLHWAAFICFGTRQYDQVIRYVEESIERESSNRAGLTALFLVPAYRNMGNYPKAIQLEKESDLLFGNPPTEVEAKSRALEQAYKLHGAEGYWKQLLDWNSKAGIDPIWLAVLHARVGNTNQAIEYLNQALETTPTQLAFVLNREPAFDRLRFSPRFTEAVRKLGFEK